MDTGGGVVLSHRRPFIGTNTFRDLDTLGISNCSDVITGQSKARIDILKVPQDHRGFVESNGIREQEILQAFVHTWSTLCCLWHDCRRKELRHLLVLIQDGRDQMADQWNLHLRNNLSSDGP